MMNSSRFNGLTRSEVALFTLSRGWQVNRTRLIEYPGKVRLMSADENHVSDVVCPKNTSLINIFFGCPNAKLPASDQVSDS